MRLSRLQKTILLLGLKDGGFKGNPSYSTSRVDVTPADVKVVYYGFQLKQRGRLFFDKSQIGFDRYNNAAVAIARAFNHLERKGLAERVNCLGLRLTDKGREAARGIEND